MGMGNKAPAVTGGCVLAFDFGLKHVGVATGQTITQTATPLTTLKAVNGKLRWQEIEELISACQPV